MWAAENKLYVLGGENLKGGASPSTGRDAVRTILAFEAFDLETKMWKPLRCVGDDPWELMEFTVLPLYRDQDEPSAIIVWGGYKHIDADLAKNPPSLEEYEALYGDEAQDVGLPYRRRLLRFDLATKVWTLLKPLSPVSVTPTGMNLLDM